MNLNEYLLEVVVRERLAEARAAAARRALLDAARARALPRHRSAVATKAGGPIRWWKALASLAAWWT
ncbi:MAG: hypothetical protein HY727_13230 [Candidatus Rokubacteria bacterium]|nr:hypothetical protein [Candidatus Rokubacteria bacterium]